MKRHLLSTLICKRSFARPVVKPKANRPIIQLQKQRNLELEKKAEEKGLSWRLVTASILHRYPVVTSDVEQWEQDMYDVEEKIMKKKREAFMEQVGGTDAQFIPDSYPEPDEILQSMPFQPAPRITEADLNNDRRSLERQLPRSLFLLVKRSRSDKAWQFPQGKLIGEETMRKGAERVLDRAVGNVRRYFISNAPIGHYCYEYPEELQRQRQQFGAKVFFYRAQLIEGDIRLETRLYTDFAWIVREEVGEYVDPDMAEYITALLTS